MPFIQCVDSPETGRLGSPRGYSGGLAGSFRRPSRSSGALRAQLRQAAQSYEVVGGHVQRQQLVYLVQSSHHHVAQLANGLGPAEALLDALSHPHADLVAHVARGALVDGAATQSVGVLRNMRRDLEFTASLDEAFWCRRPCRPPPSRAFQGWPRRPASAPRRLARRCRWPGWRAR
jgi:hypothetical protein